MALRRDGCRRETFLALKQGLQNALWALGGAPLVIRSDNTSALTHEIKRSRGRALNDAYAELLDHYGLRSTLINSGESHENGVAEQAHYRLKDALDQALMLRGSRDFDSVSPTPASSGRWWTGATAWCRGSRSRNAFTCNPCHQLQLVFSQWEHIFANPMSTAAAIDRVVHHSVILEFDVPSYRTGVAQQRSQEQEVNRQE